MNAKMHFAIIVVLSAFVALKPDLAGMIWAGAKEYSSLIGLIRFVLFGLPAIGLIVIGSLRRIVRTGKWFDTDFDRTEILMMTYGASIFIALIVSETRTNMP